MAVSVVLLCLPSFARAGAWCMKKGSVYSKISYNTYFTDYTFDEHGSSRRNPNGSTFRDINYSFYAEYGLFENISITASLPYKQLKSHVRIVNDEKLKKTTYKYHGPGDLELGSKYGLFENPFVLSVQFLSKFAWFYDGHEEVLPGNNQNDYEVKFLLGKSLWPLPGYCGLELGYRWRTGDPSDEYRYLLEVGSNITERLSCRIKLDGIKSVKNGRLPPELKPSVNAYIDQETGQVVKRNVDTSDTASVFANPSLGLEYDLAKLEFTLACQITKRWSGEVTYTNYPYGENIADGDQYSFAVIYYY
jgi:hypothetical protein